MQRLISKGLIGLIARGKALPPRVDQINCVDLTSKKEMLLFNQCRWFNQVNQYIPSTVQYVQYPSQEDRARRAKISICDAKALPNLVGAGPAHLQFQVLLVSNECHLLERVLL